jgi:hypothetical protein
MQPIHQVVDTKDLPEKLKKMRYIMDQINEQSFVQTWDKICFELNKFSPTTGNELITSILTFTAQLAARFIAQTMAIANEDDTGFTIAQLANSVTDGIHKLLETKEVRKVEKSNAEDVYKNLGIKKLD